MTDNNERLFPGGVPPKEEPGGYPKRVGNYVFGADGMILYAPIGSGDVADPYDDSRYISQLQGVGGSEDFTTKTGTNNGSYASFIEENFPDMLKVPVNDKQVVEKIETEMGVIEFTPSEVDQIIDSQAGLYEYNLDNIGAVGDNEGVGVTGGGSEMVGFFGVSEAQEFIKGRDDRLRRIRDGIGSRIIEPRIDDLEGNIGPLTSMGASSLIALVGLIGLRGGRLSGAVGLRGGFKKRAPIPLIHEVGPAVELAGYRYRQERLVRDGLRDDVEAFLGKHPDIMAGVRAVEDRTFDLNDGAYTFGELHRVPTPWLAGVMSEPDARRQLMGGVQRVATKESDDIKQRARRARKNFPETDVLVVGAGPAAAVFTARVRRERPEASVLSADVRNHLGGQFASYGERPVFEGNSRSDRRQTSEFGLPGGNQNINSFGPYAALQLTDIVPGSTFTNVDMGHVAAMNQFLSGPTVMGARLVDVEGERGQYRAVFVDQITGREFPIIVNDKIVMMSGAGERRSSQFGPGVMTAEEVFSHFGNENELFPMDMFTDKTVAIIGGGDTGRAVARLMAGIAPREAYGKSVTQLGRPNAVLWYGTDFRTRDQYCDTARPIYSPLAPYIARQAGGADGALIIPYDSKVEKVRKINNAYGEQLLIDSYGSGPLTADVVIDATTLENKAEVPFVRGGVLDGRYVYASGEELGFDTEQRTAIARQLRRGIYVAGAALRPTLTDYETAQFADGIVENTVSMWASAPRVDALARRQVQGALPGLKK
ncbi:MAG: NAD(P)/FAD-dependent oxidoreductase [Candidatus Saccharibacteria bacterium]|nr:NAD(P)/FAD-dependent oxidoreductase [Candidatus Saccharibacteria bacterium]